jgi:hypothetical protein
MSGAQQDLLQKLKHSTKYKLIVCDIKEAQYIYGAEDFIIAVTIK